MFILISRELILSDGLGIRRIRSLYGRNPTGVYIILFKWKQNLFLTSRSLCIWLWGREILWCL